MKSLKFQSKNSSITASIIDGISSRLKAKGKSIEGYSIHISPEGKTSTTIYW